MRTAEIVRKTNETDITLRLDLDGGKCSIDTGVGFLNHMLELFARHGHFGLELVCRGDLNVDAHHTVEDTALCLGEAFKKAAGDCRGIGRYGDIILPMDEALILCAVDFGGRPYLGFDLPVRAKKVGDFDTELVEEFMRAFVSKAAINLHLRKLAGTNTHHIIEGAFKAFSRCLSRALEVDGSRSDEIPSTKGVL